MADRSTIAAVDLGSNSFHCQIARVTGDQFFPLDSLREPVRLGAGLGKDKTKNRRIARSPAWRVSASGCAVSTAARYAQ